MLYSALFTAPRVFLVTNKLLRGLGFFCLTNEVVDIPNIESPNNIKKLRLSNLKDTESAYGWIAQVDFIMTRRGFSPIQPTGSFGLAPQWLYYILPSSCLWLRLSLLQAETALLTVWHGMEQVKLLHTPTQRTGAQFWERVQCSVPRLAPNNVVSLYTVAKKKPHIACSADAEDAGHHDNTCLWPSDIHS